MGATAANRLACHSSTHVFEPVQWSPESCEYQGQTQMKHLDWMPTAPHIVDFTYICSDCMPSRDLLDARPPLPFLLPLSASYWFEPHSTLRHFFYLHSQMRSGLKCVPGNVLGSKGGQLDIDHMTPLNVDWFTKQKPRD